jgi:hypothetical protein
MSFRSSQEQVLAEQLNRSLNMQASFLRSHLYEIFPAGLRFL